MISPAYEEFVMRAKRVRDVVDGEYRLKSCDLAGLASVGGPLQSIYLRNLNPADKSDWNKERNRGYINGARLFNASARTLSGMMGMLFRASPQWPDLKAMDYLIHSVDGAGLALDQQAQSTAWHTLQVGRHGLLADMPRNNQGVEVTQGMIDGGFRAGIYQYTAENIVDYNESIFNGSKLLDLLVLREFTVKFNDNRLDRQVETVYKVYRLTDIGVTVQIYDDMPGAPISEEILVVAAGNKPLTAIPFVFVGSINNSPDYDLLPLEPLVDVNLGHYQESANLRSSAHQSSAAQLVIADDNYSVAASRPDQPKIETGEMTAIVLGTGGSASYVAPDPNTLSNDLMSQDELRMVALGAQLITGGGQAETAEAARIKHASDVSILENVAVNIGGAYEKMLGYCHDFMGVRRPDLSCSLNRDFYESKLTPQEIDSTVRLWQGGGISKQVLDMRLQAGKVIPEFVDLGSMNEEIQSEITQALDFGEEQSTSTTTQPVQSSTSTQ